jgi:quinoprotein glucose dehydrogenase
MWGVTPIDQLGCRIQFRGYRYDGPFTPPSIQGSLVYPGVFGVIEWGSVSIDPTRKIIYANSSWTPFIFRLKPRAGAGHTSSASRIAHALSAFGYVADFGGPGQGTPYAAWLYPMMSLLRVPCVQPPWGHMTAIDLQSRTILWRHPIGTARDSGPLGVSSSLPLLIGIPNTGGSVVTRSGLVFIGATADKTFRALDAQTGRELWRDYLPAGAQATPSIYRARDGHEYVVVAAGGHTYLSSTLGDALIAYRLP